MKDFFKMMLATICGFLVVNIVIFLFSLGIFGALMASTNSTPVLPKQGVLTLDFSKFTIAEQTTEADPLSSLSSFSPLSGGVGEIKDVVGIWDAIQAIEMAAEDPMVQYIFIKSDGNTVGLTHLEELRAALTDFRKVSGKAVVSYVEAPTTGSYYIASVSDKVYMTVHPGASAMITGVGTQMFFLGDLLKNLGVNVQLIRHGKYKSAGEMYTKSSSSPENREQNQVMVNSLWSCVAEEIAQSRGISVAQLNSAINDLKLVLPEDFVECGLVDELFTRTQLQDKLAALAVADSFKNVNFIQFKDYVTAKILPSFGLNEIAVIYADGEIIDGKEKQQVAGDRFASLIAKVRNNPSVKAVVLRVNSPGGSVLASEKIKAELDSLRKVKPLVASYGDYAASGGYWISNACDKIFTDNTTLTGSIGVFSMIPEFSNVAKKVGVNIETVSSNKHGDMYGLMRPFDNAEYNYVLKSIESIYDRFTSIVAENRGMTVPEVDAIAQGRVWSGADALKIGLADERGGIEAAIRYAAALASVMNGKDEASVADVNLSDWSIKGYPTPPTALESIMELISDAASTPEEVILAKAKSLTKPAILARMDWNIEIR